MLWLKSLSNEEKQDDSSTQSNDNRLAVRHANYRTLWYNIIPTKEGSMKQKYSIKKYNGDDIYSWAVFRAQDVKGLRSPIFCGDAHPVMSGMNRSEAKYQKTRLEAK
jgi:hypothetical protein